MTVEEKAYNYASKVAKNRLTASEVAAHYGRGYIEGQEDMRHLAPFVCVSNKTWRPASVPPTEKDVEVVMLVDVSSPQFTGAPLIRIPIFGRYINGWPKDVNVKWWCYPPKEEEQ